MGNPFSLQMAGLRRPAIFNGHGVILRDPLAAEDLRRCLGYRSFNAFAMRSSALSNCALGQAKFNRKNPGAPNNAPS